MKDRYEIIIFWSDEDQSYVNREKAGRDVFYINTGLYDLFKNFSDMH
jgi:hypothetical protein